MEFMKREQIHEAYACCDKSKFLPPNITGTLDRIRLIDVLAKHKKCRLIWVSGNAAQGKSTLMASYIQRLSHPVVWINLGPAESDATRFFEILVEALQPVITPENWAYLISLPAVVAGIGPHHDHGHFARPLLERFPTAVTIVLDDFDQLDPTASSHHLLKALIVEAPDTVHWSIISRSKPPFSIEALRIKKKALLLTNDALAFNKTEIRQMYESLWRVRLTMDQYQAIERATEGWAGGLVLLAQALNQISEAQRSRSLEKYIGEHLFADSFAFFQEVILNPLPESDRKLLIQAAVFPEILPDVLAALSEPRDLEKILNEFCNKHLFVTKTYDPDKGWIFRLHNLFREFLKNQWQRSFDSAFRKEFLCRAARISERRGYVQSAIDLWIAAGDLKACGRLLAGEGIKLWFEGHHAELQQHLTRLPDELIESNCWLTLCKALTDRSVDLAACHRGLHGALAGFESKADTRGRLIALAMLIETAIISGQESQPLIHLVQKAEAFLSRNALEIEAHTFEASCLLNQISMFQTSRGAAADERMSTCQSALRIARKSAHPLQLFQAHSSNAMAHIMTCDFTRAREHLDILDELVTAHPYPQLKCLHYGLQSLFYFFIGNSGAHAATLGRFKDVIQKNQLFFFEPLFLCNEILLANANRDYDKAINLADRVYQETESAGNHFLKGIAIFHLGVARYRKQTYSDAASDLHKALAIFRSEQAISDAHAHMTYAHLGFVLTHTGRFDKAAHGLEKARIYYQSANNTLFILDVLLGKALLAHRRGHVRDVPLLLRQAFSGMAMRNASRLIIISPEDMALAACLALDYAVEDVFETVVEALVKIPPRCLPELYMSLFKHRQKSVRNAVQVVDEAHHHASRPILKIKTLGEFSVTWEDRHETVSWDRRIAQKLMKVVLCHDGVVPVEPLMEILWPESTLDKQRRNFKVTLHRLRKILEPDMHKRYGSSYLKLPENELRLDLSLCRVDASHFEELCRKADQAEQHGDDQGARNFYQDALDLYKGDLLANDLYEPWIEPKRRRLRNRWRQSALRLADIFARRHHLDKALKIYERIIEADPTDETAYRHMMRVYAEKGLSEAVRSTYQRCATALRTENDIEPGIETQAMYMTLLKMRN
jgi:DNA-binding SARP family transcriptional activator